MNPILLQRIEGFFFLIFSLWIYAAMGGSWLLFAGFILVPDISMVAYRYGARWGAYVYNLAHTYSVPMLLGVIGYVVNEPYLLYGSIVWVAHISADRLLGYGLKLESGFKDTHLGRVGKASPEKGHE